MRVKLIDPEGRPIPGIRLVSWLFRKPQWTVLDCLNISGVKDFQKKTDAAGTAVFDWIPKWNKQLIVFWQDGGERWTDNRIEWDPQKDPPEITVSLQRTVPVRGQVRHADGSPAAGILIQVEGTWRSIVPPGGQTGNADWFVGQTWTGERGMYEIRVRPDLTYLFAINDEHWAAPARGGIVVWPNTPVEGIDFQLQAATRLHGQLTLGPEKSPGPGGRFTWCSTALSNGRRSQAFPARQRPMPKGTTRLPSVPGNTVSGPKIPPPKFRPSR